MTFIESPVSHTSGRIPHTLLTLLTLAGLACGGDSTAPSTGSMAFTVIGLPTGTSAAIAVTGPRGFNQSVTVNKTLASLAPGEYSIVASNVGDGNATYAPAPPSQTVTVRASSTPMSISIAYGLVSGNFNVTINGLPQGTSAAVSVTGPGGYTRSLVATTSLSNLTPGTYNLSAAQVSTADGTWSPTPTGQSVTVAAGATPATASVTYARSTGSLGVTIAGLPGGVDAAVTVTGPGYSQPLTASQTLNNLAPGSYTITASPVTSGASSYTPSPPSQSVSVAETGSSSAIVTYTLATAATLNLRIDGMYVVQSSQNYAGTVPLVANRDGLLRVFVLANQPNVVTPSVRVRFYQGASVVSTMTIPAQVGAVPTVATEGTFLSSWNVSVPGSLIQPGMSVVADVDPNNTIAEADESDNAFPVSGAPLAPDVRQLGSFNVVFVPVHYSANGLTGNVTEGNKEQFLVTTTRMHPIASYSAQVRAPFTTSEPEVQSNDANGAWGRILNEIRMLRISDSLAAPGSPWPYYVGIARASYTSGVAGVGYLPGRAALAWDHLPSADRVIAHELGHNWGRFHAPCGGPQGVDQGYPYAGGAIGTYGFDVAAGLLKVPTLPDVMGYCGAGWISDYNYTGILTYRSNTPNALVIGAAPQPSLLVWGRIVRGEVVLEPAFTIVTRPALPERPGPYRVEALDASGAPLLSVSFAGDEVADLPSGDEQHFSFAIPLAGLDARQIASLRLSGGGRAARSIATSAAVAADPAAAAAAAAPALESAGRGRVRLTWDNRAHPMVMVRDPRTGQVLSFARGGSSTVITDASELELVMSHGVASVARRMAVVPR